MAVAHTLRDNSKLSNSSARRMVKDARLGDQLSLAETASCCSEIDDVMQAGVSPRGACDACPNCNDKCSDPDCLVCDDSTCPRMCQPCDMGGEERRLTMCQVKRHASKNSAWLVAGQDVYDATEYLKQHHHPGGTDSILRKAGGKADCLRDLQFHSRTGARMWKKYKVGVLCPCNSSRTDQSIFTSWWNFWNR